MSKLESNEALSVISSAVDESHDGLAAFTEKLKSIEDIPAFWWGDHPVWVAEYAADTLSPWPLSHARYGRARVISSEGDRAFTLQLEAIRDFSETFFDTPLSDAEFALFADLATGLSIEDSAARASVAISTRRKQLQSCFRKRHVTSQAELISLANRVIDRLATSLTAHLGTGAQEWTAYAPFLPDGVRCCVLEGATHRAVRYLEIGPVTGRPVFILHPMVFPHIEQSDVDLFHDLGWRTIWPVRSGCLSTRTLAAMDWEDHCAQTIADLKAMHGLCDDQPVPVIALVSSGAYATRFAQTHPESVARIDYVSTCFSAGNSKTRDVYFGDYLLRNLRRNGRMAVVAIQHLAGVVFGKNQLEPTLRRIFKGSAVDQETIRQDFASPERAKRITFAVSRSIDSIRYDYLSQLNFQWSLARKIPVTKCFWHGAQDGVHRPDDLSNLSRQVCGQKAHVIAGMGHLTQGAPLREVFRQIAAAYSK